MTPIDFQDPIKTGRTAAPARRKIAISLLVVLIVAVMVLWFGFLGWGVVEIIGSALAVLKGILVKLL